MFCPPTASQEITEPNGPTQQEGGKIPPSSIQRFGTQTRDITRGRGTIKMVLVRLQISGVEQMNALVPDDHL